MFRIEKMRILCFLFAVFLAFILIVYPTTNAHAFAPVLVAALAPEAIATVGSIIVACGVSIAATEAFNYAIESFWNSASDPIRSSIIASSSTLVNGMAVVADSVWNFAKSFRQKFQEGTNTYSYSQYYFQGYPASSLGDNISPLYDITLSGTRWRIELGSDYYVVYYGDNVYESSYTWSSSKPIFMYLDYQSDFVHLMLYKNGYTTRMTSYSIPTVGSSVPVTIPYTGSPILSNSEYDFKNSSGERMVGVPVSSDVSKLLDKTYTDVQNKPIAEATVAPTTAPNTALYPNTWTGSFKDCAPGMSSYTFAGRGTIVGEMDHSLTGTWTGSWTWTKEGTRVWTGTYVDAQGRTWTGTATESVSSSMEGNIDWGPLSVAGNLFTNRFPFSLPWDLMRSFTTLAADEVAPDFRFQFYTKLLGYVDFKVDLSMFEDLRKVAKTIELLAFDVGLVLITRKLLGGAT